LKKIVQKILPKKFIELYHSIRYPKPPFVGWTGDYSSWEEASAIATGYNANTILKKVDQGLSEVLKGNAAFERDSVPFKELQYSKELLKVFTGIASEFNKQLNIVDFGGSLGSTYYQYRTLLKDFKLTWSVVEQGNFVTLGQQKFSNTELSFYDTVSDALKTKPHEILLLSSVLAYLDRPYDFLNSILPQRFKYIVFYRTAFVDREKDLLTVQYVSPEIYKASYPSWFFNETKLIDVLHKDYVLERTFQGDIEKEIKVDEHNCYWKCLVFKLKE
jgi:putative methyltransferase (TIGR04325 family)